MIKKTGIYKIVNIKTKKIYVGSAVDIVSRWVTHKHGLINNFHHSKKLQNSYNKHGIENFIFEIIEECPREMLIEREQYWLDALKSVDDGYNVCPKAGSSLGRKHSDNTKKKIGLKSKGRIHSRERNKKISEANKGRLVGIKNPMYGKKVSEETKQKISLSISGNKNPFYGKKHSEETKNKLSKICGKKGRDNPRYLPTPIIQYDMEGNIVKEWFDLISIKEDGNFNYKTVSRACRKIIKKYKNYIWEFKNN